VGAGTHNATIRIADRIGIQRDPTAPVAVGIQTMKIGLVGDDLVDDAQNLMIATAAEKTVAANFVAPRFRLGTKQSHR